MAFHFNSCMPPSHSRRRLHYFASLVPLPLVLLGTFLLCRLYACIGSDFAFECRKLGPSVLSAILEFAILPGSSLYRTVRYRSLETSLWKPSAGFSPSFLPDIGNWLAGLRVSVSNAGAAGAKFFRRKPACTPDHCRERDSTQVHTARATRSSPPIPPRVEAAARVTTHQHLGMCVGTRILGVGRATAAPQGGDRRRKFLTVS